MYILRNFFLYNNGEQIARYAYTEKCLFTVAAYNNSELHMYVPRKFLLVVAAHGSSEVV